MRNRARQPSEFTATDDSSDTDESLVKVEAQEPRKKTPSCCLAAKSTSRIYYACMDDHELVVRQSPLYSSETRASAPFDVFACILPSHPLRESGTRN
ncbi:uncharacterized protein BJX67DRAFT_189574 [Aspergillus lucknowensis]|uniref:Uncharacterized protein n=1 Tax=Aspergillus lucknowensis TaxID=176173 RepID=A0ABR4LKU3_9EURO